METTLHVPIGKNGYCGPAALTILAGGNTTDAAALLRKITGRKKITRTPKWAMLKALNLCGLQTRTIFDYDKPKGGSLQAFADKADPGRYFVRVTGHFVVLDTTGPVPMVADNHTIYPLEVSRYRMRQKRIKGVWAVTGTPTRNPVAIERELSLTGDKKILAMAKKLKAKVSQCYDGSYEMDAPDGFVWVNSDTHFMRGVDAADAIERMSEGLVACNTPDCEYCEETA